jgi:hypothetical protein
MRATDSLGCMHAHLLFHLNIIRLFHKKFLMLQLLHATIGLFRVDSNIVVHNDVLIYS